VQRQRAETLKAPHGIGGHLAFCESHLRHPMDGLLPAYHGICRRLLTASKWSRGRLRLEPDADQGARFGVV
jgi:hypothetical protein